MCQFFPSVITSHPQSTQEAVTLLCKGIYSFLDAIYLVMLVKLWVSKMCWSFGLLFVFLSTWYYRLTRLELKNCVCLELKSVRAWIHFRVPYKVMIRVQQLVLLVLASIGWHHCRTRNSISPHNWSTVRWPVPIGWWHRVSPAINNHQHRTQDPIGPRNWSIVMWLAPIGWWCRVSPAIYTTRTQG